MNESYTQAMFFSLSIYGMSKLVKTYAKCFPQMTPILIKVKIKMLFVTLGF